MSLTVISETPLNIFGYNDHDLVKYVRGRFSKHSAYSKVKMNIREHPEGNYWYLEALNLAEDCSYDFKAGLHFWAGIYTGEFWKVAFQQGKTVGT